MLHRAASNAYSWWWASHIRTKQSKWLEQNLQDMEDKVEDTLKIVNDDGDSFAQRAEMYYRKRPEIINFVEEAYRSYRALAERYDHLSRDLQSANRTIATVFPEQVQFSIDAEDEENQRETSTSSHDFNKSSNINKSSIPKIPKIPKKDFRSPSMSRKGQLKRTSSVAKALAPSSGLSKSEALEEIDKLQKGILALQTEKEFVKSSYERGYEKYWDIENVITEMQAKVCGLQDEFGVGIVIDDNEARNLMAATALKSCRETLNKLKDQQEESVAEAKMEYQRIIEAHERFSTLRNRFLPNQTDHNENSHEYKCSDSSIEEKGVDSGLLREKINERLAIDSNSSLTMTQLAEKLEELVDIVVTLEVSVSSENAMVKRLRSEIDQLYENLRNLEEEKEILTADSESLRNKVQMLEEELQRVNKLNQSLEDENEKLRKQLAEANCNIDDLSEKLQNVKVEEEIEETAGLFPYAKTGADEESEIKENEEEKLLPPDDDVSVISKDKEDPSNAVRPEADNVNEIENDRNFNQDGKDEKKFMSETASSTVYIEQEEMALEEGEEIPNWKQLLLNGLEDREKIILDEYTSVLKNYKDVQRKLSDVEKKNRDGFIELALQIRELKSAVSTRDEEIHSLRNKLGSGATNLDGNHHNRLSEWHQESITQGASSPASNITSPHSNQRQILDSSLSDQIYDFKERSEIEERNFLKSARRDQEQHYALAKGKNVKSLHAIPTIEESIRSDIDELLEENLEFWLRFSTSFHQMRKFYTSVQDLKAELYKLKSNKKQDSSSPKNVSMNSDARPIYKHLREIQTELTLWIENNSVLKDELHDRYSSLCNIQDEISRITSADVKGEESELSDYQAAKFHGEIMNMKQENKKITDELASGLDRVKNLRKEVERTLANLEDEFRQHAPIRNPSSRARIPLRSFLFGVKLKKQKEKKQSLFSCMNPSLQKQYSYLTSNGIPQ